LGFNGLSCKYFEFFHLIIHRQFPNILSRPALVKTRAHQ
jgi:hypothetical protein